MLSRHVCRLKTEAANVSINKFALQLKLINFTLSNLKIYKHLSYSQLVEPTRFFIICRWYWHGIVSKNLKKENISWNILLQIYMCSLRMELSDLDTIISIRTNYLMLYKSKWWFGYCFVVCVCLLLWRPNYGKNISISLGNCYLILFFFCRSPPHMIRPHTPYLARSRERMKHAWCLRVAFE